MLTIQTLITGLLMGGIYSLFAMGLSLIFGVIRVVNFAHGSFAILAAYIARELAIAYNVDPFISLAIVFPLFFLLGLIIYPTLVRDVALRGGRASLFLTFGLAQLIDGLCLYFWRGDPRTIPASYAIYIIELGPLMLPVVRFVSLIVAIAVTFLVYFFISKTFFGKAIRATILDREAAQLMGININYTVTMGFGIGIALASLAGVLSGIIYGFNPGSAGIFVFRSLVCVVMGGLGDPFGTTIAAFILGYSEAIFMSIAPAALTPILAFLLLLIVLIIRPRGIRGAGLA
ncbi:MAG: branched-chain amino acid ABC transporter permease [candidate division WOR-3 bacterium]